ncbi:MAG: signal peptidase II [Pseudohongiella sp.]|nr:signal peptidase II [Pseudohongiella sp.]MDO9520717.1 signal peptidase II [Pseudohongiella sp.]MDP2126998.1 signal peptidase II [Pseudohongiella sp.]
MSAKAFLLGPAQSSRQKHFVWFALIALVCLGLSQLGSYLIYQYLPQGETIVVLPVLHFTHIRNLGGVFGMAQGQGWLFAVFSLALIAALVSYLWRSAQVRTYEFLCFGFVAGGGISNVLDRLIYGSVIDFINVQGIPYWNYIFNTADTFIHIGLWPMLFIALFLHRD